MRLYEIESPRRLYHSRETIPLRTINKWKIARERELLTAKTRAPLIAAMYGQPIEAEASHNAKMRAFELEREKVELAKDKAELASLKAEQGKEAFNAIQRLSRSAMRRRKKD